MEQKPELTPELLELRNPSGPITEPNSTTEVPQISKACPASDYFLSNDEDEDCELISVIAPTMERRAEYHEGLYRCFDAQTWPNKQLIIIDSGHKPSPFFRCISSPKQLANFVDTSQRT